MIREVHHLPGESLRKIAREAADLAVSGIFITGGEPFLSDDIYDAVNSFIDNRIYVTVTTKARVDGSRLCRGAREFLNVECSLDSTDRSLVSYLTGSTASFDEAVATMKSLSRHGIPFRIKMVVGKSNAGDVPAMARLCAELGGTTLQVMEYRSHIGRYVKNFLLNDTLRDHIRQSIERSRLEYGIGIEESIGSKSVKYDGLPGSYCPEGIKSLSFLPDGTCTKCPMIPLDMNVTGGNVFKDGIYSVWNDDPGYASAVFPDKSVYAGSSCNNCETLDKCSLTGRCIVRSNVRNARYFGPDRDCPRSPPGPGCE